MIYLNNCSDSRVTFHYLFNRYWRELAQYSRELRNNPLTEHDIDERYFKNDALLKYFLVEGDNVVGFIVVQYVDETCGVENPLWYIVEFYILPQYRRCNYGKKAIATFLSMINCEFFFVVLKKNVAALRFWKQVMKQLGCRPCKRKDISCSFDKEVRFFCFRCV